MNKYTIKDLGNGWYDFSKIPQEKSYIKIGAVNCKTWKKAFRQAEHILEVNGLLRPNEKINIEIE